MEQINFMYWKLELWVLQQSCIKLTTADDNELYSLLMVLMTISWNYVWSINKSIKDTPRNKKNQKLRQVLVDPILYKANFWVICLAHSPFQLPPHFSSLFIPCVLWINYLQLLSGKQTLQLGSRQPPTVPAARADTASADSLIASPSSRCTGNACFILTGPSAASFYIADYHR